MAEREVAREVVGMDNPNGGLAINQLVKMKCAGVISLEQFLARAHCWG